MKKFLKPEKLIGPAIKGMGQNLGLTLFQMKSALSDSLQKHRDEWGGGKFEYSEETVNGYLYNRAWPNMTQEMTITIILDAFTSALERKGKASERELEQTIKNEIQSIYDACKREKISKETNHVLIHIISFNPSYGNFLLKHWDACSGLTGDEIKFWDIVSEWTEKQRKDCLAKWNKEKSTLEINSLFQSVTSPAFYQWLTIRNKDYSERDRKSKETTLNIPKEVDEKLYDLTEAQIDSLYAIQTHMYINEGKIHKKHKLCLPSEIDLILLFKYFLSDKQKI